MQNYLRLFAALGALAVALGAFGAHGLKSLVGPAELETFATGIRYHFYHVFALGFVVVLSALPGFSLVRLGRAAWCFGIGILLFSGSLYLLSLREVHGLPVSFLGPITPVGGVFFIAGWVFLFISLTDKSASDV
ncbi:DUF423 domain-containing protein [Neolewinella antarctica]|uniref:Uncharacterized membrane protein YgdD (TMEM256/DUF423 family) n=1 Tax=Neolewinella antarctica TaxID=442734 RepID=A0ABX0X862_9BACT|nr:DUF423 domain-containing protein [Neolewinella antarctica]NJC25191.1 uncharacterized membrane protein YgdD (TMEM256/DUF423 family) [Neolewinella antarctica]